MLLQHEGVAGLAKCLQHTSYGVTDQTRCSEYEVWATGGFNTLSPRSITLVI